MRKIQEIWLRGFNWCPVLVAIFWFFELQPQTVNFWGVSGGIGPKNRVYQAILYPLND